MSQTNELDTLRAMIGLFCRDHHDTEALCTDCSELLDYAAGRLANCRYGAEKPKCRVCPVHCYSPAMRSRISEVMRYAGPRMLLHHPVMGLRHLLNRNKP